MRLMGRERPLPVLIVVGVVTIATASFAGQKAAVNAFSSLRPEVALGLSPSHGPALRRQFDLQLLQAKGLPDDLAKSAARARTALKRDPLDAGLVRMLAISSSSSGSDKVGRLMLQAERISRRDLLTQLWMIEDAVGDGDVGRALLHYDRALSTHPGVGDQLFPILTGALEQPQIRQALVPYLRANRPWAVSFLLHAAQRAGDPTMVADLYLRYGGGRAVPAHAPLGTLILGRLTANRQHEAARGFAAQFADPASVNEFGFSDATFDPSVAPLAWTINADAEAEVVRTPGSEIEIALGGGKRVVALSRDVLLAPGRWRFRQRISYSALAAKPDLTWTASCLTKAGPERVWRFELSPSPQMRTESASILTVPANCGALRFELAVNANPSDESQVTIRHVAIERV